MPAEACTLSTNWYPVAGTTISIAGVAVVTESVSQSGSHHSALDKKETYYTQRPQPKKRIASQETYCNPTNKIERKKTYLQDVTPQPKLQAALIAMILLCSLEHNQGT
jgi:hypothetical protein